MMREKINRKIKISQTSAIAIAAMLLPGAAMAQDKIISQPAMPLSRALQRIAAEWQKPINVDPDAVKRMTALPVVDASSEREAVRQATHGLPVAVEIGEDGTISILNDVVVTAHRDEAETSVMVRSTTTSSRLGQTVREQPRNVQVISSKLLDQQQARSLQEALTDAGGVVVNTATVQGGINYSIRGFTSNGAVNGMPSPASNNFAAGSTVPIANVERIEVLKGPDAILLGVDEIWSMASSRTRCSMVGGFGH